MAVTSRGRTELQIPKKWKDRETSPERTKIWTEPRPKTERKVPVVYYLSRNGHLEHPHFMEVPLSSSEGLYLRDVINRLNVLRGKGMPSMYSWSSKRSYKNGFVWHDLSENDFIYPAHDLHEYKVYKTESTGECAGKAADASTQTDDKRRRRRIIREEEVQEKAPPIEEEQYEDQSTELSREEISPPPSSSSPETLESLIKADGHLISRSGGVEGADIRDQTANISSSGRMKASAVLMQLISCGTISIKDCSTMPSSGKDQGFSLISHYRARIPRGASNQVTKEVECLMENPSYGGVRLEDKEYFSGSLVETKKDEFPALKRSSSYNADRSSKLDLADKEIEGVRAKCIPRKPKTPGKKESNDVSRSSIHGSKRHGDEPVINQID
uniref:SOSEKI DIX-like domain-containing protein n=1 Tax=Nelumbo nucifera TaxID=4432 RepID=A0A822XZW8_NELNU|nr:TPA_asm: hypothetical protein HUJ06_027388 [Nelumbo nucifera]